jgi:hypothetical protein
VAASPISFAAVLHFYNPMSNGSPANANGVSQVEPVVRFISTIFPKKSQ